MYLMEKLSLVIVIEAWVLQLLLLGIASAGNVFADAAVNAGGTAALFGVCWDVLDDAVGNFSAR